MKFNIRRLILVTFICGVAWMGNIYAGPSMAADSALSGKSFQSAGIDWRMCGGETIKVLLSGHPIQSAILGLLQEFKDLTGVDVKVDVMSEEEFFQKLNIDFEKGRGDIDVFMTSPLHHWRYARMGWIEGLNQYLADSRLTDKKWYDPGDFFPELWRSSMWNGDTGSGLGDGEIYSIPVWWEGCALMYRKDLAGQYDFKAPGNWDDLYRQMARIQNMSDAMHGLICRGIRSWSQIHTYHLSMMVSEGGRDINPVTGEADFDSPAGIKAGEYWIKMMREAGSPAWPKYNWYEVASKFQAGESFAIIDANPFAIMLEAPGSALRGKVGYLQPPRGTKGRRSFLWIWSLGLNSYSKHKTAGWLFIQWVTSKAVLRKAVDYSNWMAPRRSVWFDPEVQHLLKEIDNGRWYRNSTALVTDLAKMRWSPNPNAATLGNLWAGAVQDAWRHKGSIAENLRKAASEYNSLMKHSGSPAPE